MWNQKFCIVDQLKPNKSAGHNKIGNFIIKKVSDEIVKPLACIFNLSVSTGIVAENLKVAKVIPITKRSTKDWRCSILKLPSFVTFIMFL